MTKLYLRYEGRISVVEHNIEKNQFRILAEWEDWGHTRHGEDRICRRYDGPILKFARILRAGFHVQMPYQHWRELK